MDKRETYSKEFKKEACSLALSSGNSIAQVARDLGIREKTLGRWVKEYRERRCWANDIAGEAQNSEMLKLQKELIKLRKENEILKKASAYFAQHVK